jgi:hypothetical protein
MWYYPGVWLNGRWKSKKTSVSLADVPVQIRTEYLNGEEIKAMLLSRPQNAGQNHDIKIANRSFENVAQFK